MLSRLSLFWGRRLDLYLPESLRGNICLKGGDQHGCRIGVDPQLFLTKDVLKSVAIEYETVLARVRHFSLGGEDCGQEGMVATFT